MKLEEFQADLSRNAFHIATVASKLREEYPNLSFDMGEGFSYEWDHAKGDVFINRIYRVVVRVPSKEGSHFEFERFESKRSFGQAMSQALNWLARMPQVRLKHKWSEATLQMFAKQNAEEPREALEPMTIERKPKPKREASQS